MFCPFRLFWFILMKGSSLHSISEAFSAEGDNEKKKKF